MKFGVEQANSIGKICTICREWHGEILYTRSYVRVIRCKKCGLYYSDLLPLPTEKLSERLQIMTEESQSYLDEVYGQKTQAWLNYYSGWLDRISKYTRGRKLLDIGCGAGHLVYAAVSKGWDACGLDICSPVIAYGKAKFGLQDRLLDLPIDQANFADRFNVITLFSVIEHLDDPVTFLEKIHKNLQPDGVLFIKTPSQDSLITKLNWAGHRLTNGKFDLNLYNDEHIYRFSPETLQKTLEKAGYCIKSIFPDDHLWIAAARFLQNRKNKGLLYAALMGGNILGKLLKMENQFTVIAINAGSTQWM